jgi:hypothetical protein
MAHREVDLEASGADLFVDLVAQALDGGCDRFLEWRVEILGRWPMFLEDTGLSVLEKAFENPRTLAFGAIAIDVAGRKRGEYFASIAGAGEEHIETALATFDWAEAHAVQPRACDAWAIPDGDEDHVAFITLYILEILDKDILCFAFTEEFIQGQISAAFDFEEVGDGVALSGRERNDPERESLTVPGMVDAPRS